MKNFDVVNTNKNGNLEIGGCDTINLAEQFGTPLYVIDEQEIRNTCNKFKSNFSLEGIECEVIYASKAFLNLAICKIIEEEGLSLDVVSGGELYTALKSGFPADKIYMHGNNKTKSELTLAIKSNIKRIVIDNKSEIDLLEHLCESLNKNIEVLLRVNPGIEAHTHEYIQTSKNDSKFGESIFDKDIYLIVERLMNSSRINFKGFHCHIGSQIFQEESFYMAVKVMLDFVKKTKEKCNFICNELNIGGGFGVFYADGDKPLDLQKCLSTIPQIIKQEAKKLKIEIPKIMIEPGRSIVANAGITLYEIGNIKQTYGGKKYIFIDGGMTDNPRTALYNAKYSAIIANKILPTSDNHDNYTVAGKCCESGDIIIKDIQLNNAEKGDILAVFSTGAYNYSMSSNYNRIPRPAVVFVKSGKAKLVVKRETWDDIIRNDMPYYG